LHKLDRITIFGSENHVARNGEVIKFAEEVMRMGKAYCPQCKEILKQVLSSFECLSNWDQSEEYYIPENECELVRRCPHCGAMTRDREKRIRKGLKKITEERVIKPVYFRKKLKGPHPVV
jgi:hypothetical protein